MTPEPPARSRARERLQGTWEIVRYESEAVIPDEAMPLMGAMFNALRLTFEGPQAIGRIEAVEERVTFTIAQETGDEFTLAAPSFMFDGARFRFLSEGEIEIRDRGKQWPGVSKLRRIP